MEHDAWAMVIYARPLPRFNTLARGMSTVRLDPRLKATIFRKSLDKQEVHGIFSTPDPHWQWRHFILTGCYRPLSACYDLVAGSWLCFDRARSRPIESFPVFPGVRHFPSRMLLPLHRKSAQSHISPNRHLLAPLFSIVSTFFLDL
jgi:hypothetical protein